MTEHYTLRLEKQIRVLREELLKANAKIDTLEKVSEIIVKTLNIRNGVVNHHTILLAQISATLGQHDLELMPGRSAGTVASDVNYISNLKLFKPKEEPNAED